jgi:hypothetical protein
MTVYTDQVPRSTSTNVCPFNGKQMKSVCHKCPLWINVKGADPQTGETVDRWNCSWAWMPMLLVENSNMQRQTGAAVESLRNRQAEFTDSFRTATGQELLPFGDDGVRTRALPKR